MNRQIEFRGRDVKTGKYVYGDLIQPWADNEEFPTIRSAQDYVDGVASLSYHRVDPDSVAQLIGTDSYVKKVYEGDTFTDEKSNKYIAGLEPFIEWQGKGNPTFRRIPIDFAKRFVKFSVEAATVEAANND